MRRPATPRSPLPSSPPSSSHDLLGPVMIVGMRLDPPRRGPHVVERDLRVRHRRGVRLVDRLVQLLPQSFLDPLQMVRADDPLLEEPAGIAIDWITRLPPLELLFGNVPLVIVLR